MSEPTTIKIDDVEYVRSDQVQPTIPAGTPVRIVVLQRGWVVVGYYSTDGDRVFVDRAKIIRKWGTTRGLGELVPGPLSDTILDPAGLVESHALGVVLTVAADADGWKDYL